jgi:hypothetical protein
MNSRNTKHGLSRRRAAAETPPDPEFTMQEHSNPLAWIIFHAIAIWSAASYRLRSLRDLILRQKLDKNSRTTEYATHSKISHGETDLRVSVTKAGHLGGPSLLAPPARNCAVPATLQRPTAGDPDTTRPTLLRGKTI